MNPVELVEKKYMEREAPEFRPGDTVRVNAVEQEGIRTFLAVPLLRDGKAIGTIALFRREVAPFDDRHLVRSLVIRVSIAGFNAPHVGMAPMLEQSHQRAVVFHQVMR